MGSPDIHHPEAKTPLEAIAGWDVPDAAAAVVGPGGVVAQAGDADWVTKVASISKPLVAYAVLIAVEEQSLHLDQPAGPPDSTLRHLLAHASGLPFQGAAPITKPGQRRIYSNTGFEAVGDTLAQATGISMSTYLTEAVFEPLGMTASELRGSPAYGVRSTVEDLARFAQELLSPTLVTETTLLEARTEQFPGLAGVIPDMGKYDPNPWGLGFEIKGHKAPHWTAPEGSPATFGHFGGTGTFLWVDPDAELGCVVLTNRRFGSWAPPLWSQLSTDVLARY